ncbi:MAG: 3-isopropylmalate dehydratase small subunit [Pirellulaceae bacterium]|jgi:3-isopropylmalate/(R)-2-methylmalate dehydratase small subunit|nr:3-isopropylmalate dehydratase small subunit [Pirellulaceae bacterium]HJN09114.1 3-isopropylmalate dehydratase small subunit [Pirellulaceae bacterium]
MKTFTTHRGLVATMDRANVDTDQIIPKQFLKRIERTGFGQYLFFDWRFNDDGSDDPSFELNQPEVAGASVLVARRNFGSGSSREHAVWALDDYGFRVVIAASFADIFYNNCFKNAVLPISLDEDTVEQIFQRAASHPGYQLDVNLENQTVSDDHGLSLSFEIDGFRRECLLKGLDDIALSLEMADKISAYEVANGIQ